MSDKKEIKEIDVPSLDSELAAARTLEEGKGDKFIMMASVVAFLMTSFHIYTGFFGLFDYSVQRGVHLGFALTLILLTQTGPLMWVGAIVMGLVGLGGPVMCLTSYINVLGRPELMSIGMGVLMLVQSLGQFLGTWLVPMLLGPEMSSWMFAGIVICIIGLIGTGALALCKFK